MKIDKFACLFFLIPFLANAETSAVSAASSAVVSAATTATTSPTTGLLQIFLALVFVICLMLGGAWLLKRINPMNSNHQVSVKVVGGTTLGNRERVMVLEIADQWLVVGVTANQINMLTSMPKIDIPIEEENTNSVPTQFSHWLKKTIDKRNESASSI